MKQTTFERRLFRFKKPDHRPRIQSFQTFLHLYSTTVYSIQGMFSKSIFIWIFPSNLSKRCRWFGKWRHDSCDSWSCHKRWQRHGKLSWRPSKKVQGWRKRKNLRNVCSKHWSFSKVGEVCEVGKLISCCELCFAGTNGFRLWGLMITWWPGLKARWINEVQTRWERLSIVEQQLLQAEQDLQELETLDKDPACWGSSFGVLWKYGSPFHGGEMCLCQ